jgi:hypothetical protein
MSRLPGRMDRIPQCRDERALSPSQVVVSAAAVASEAKGSVAQNGSTQAQFTDPASNLEMSKASTCLGAIPVPLLAMGLLLATRRNPTTIVHYGRCVQQGLRRAPCRGASAEANIAASCSGAPRTRPHPPATIPCPPDRAPPCPMTPRRRGARAARRPCWASFSAAARVPACTR